MKRINTSNQGRWMIFPAVLVVAAGLLLGNPVEAKTAAGDPEAWNISIPEQPAVVLVKNAIGIVLILVGFAMLILPGQGLLTILFGIALTNFPGKFRLERRIVNIPSVRGALDRIRSAAGRPPLRLS